MPAADVVAGRFALCDPLARGATGTVWRAWDLRRGDWCAAKVMRQRDAGDVLRFAREQAVRLEHPHVLTPYSWAAEDAHVVVASPLVGGGSLHTLVGDHGPLGPDLVADLLDQLLDGLAHVHAAGVVHRDVTPANVLLEATGAGRPVARLADFGLAVRAGEPRLTRLGTVLGTPGYVPPEVLAGAAPHPAADLYAAGRVAVTLLTGGDPDGVERGTGRLRAVVTALVADDPAARPGSAAEARAALGAVPVRAPATADGDPVVVLSQLPPLPAGWAVGRAPEVRTGPVREGVGGTARLAPAAQGSGPATAPAAGPRGAGPPGAGGSGRETGAGRPGSGGVAGRASGVGRRGWWLAAGGAVVAGGVAVVLALGGPGGGSPGPGSATPPGVPVVTGAAVAGGPCGWQQEGDGATDAGGRALLCRRTGAGFRWQPA